MYYRDIFKVVLACAFIGVHPAVAGKIKKLSLVDDPAISEASTGQGKGKGSKKNQKATKSVVLTFDTVPGNEYQVQGTSSLVSGNWDDIGSVFTATEYSTTVSFPESDSYRYFRVIVVTQNVAPSSPPPPGPPPSDPPPAPPA